MSGDVVERLRGAIEGFDAEVNEVLSGESGERADLWDEVEVNADDLRGALALITSQAAEIEALKHDIARYVEANTALMAERASLIETKREQIERLTKERDEALRLAGEDVNALQAIGEEFGVRPGEHRVTGIRRILTEQLAAITAARTLTNGGENGR